MAKDVILTAKTRKMVIACWLDISRIRVRVTRGVIHLQGIVTRLGGNPQTPQEDESFLVKLDEQLRMLPGYRGIHYSFDNWRREPTGGWRYTGKGAKAGRK